MKLKTFLVVGLLISLISFWGCSNSNNTEKAGEDAANKFLTQLYTIDSKSGAEAAASPQTKIQSADEKYYPLMTKDGYEQLRNNRIYSSMLMACGDKQHSIKLQNLELKQTQYDKDKGRIYFDYTAKVEITSDKDNKTTTTEERGKIGLSLEKNKWKVIALRPTVPSKDLR